MKPENLELAPEPAEAEPARLRRAAARGGRAASSAGAADWSAGLSPAEAYVKLTWAFQFRVEEEYLSGRGLYGAYADAAGDVALDFPSCGERDFRTFLAGAHARDALPPWWTEARELHDRECIAVARNDWGCAVERSDVQRKFGTKGPRVLRAIAERVLGGPAGTGLGGSQEAERQATLGGGARRW